MNNLQYNTNNNNNYLNNNINNINNINMQYGSNRNIQMIPTNQKSTQKIAVS